jgi:LysM domain-containing protein
MEQIAKTVNSFVAFIVGIGLICFASFVFLLASARLSNSTLGTLLARSAGETARMARTESLAFWGQVGSEVAAGFGVAQSVPAGGVSPSFTPVVVVATQAPPAPASTPRPTATPAPSSYIRSSPFSEGALLLWRGLDASGRPVSTGIDWDTLKQQINFALMQNAGDLLALWLKGKVTACQPLYDQLVTDKYKDPAQVNNVHAAAEAVLTQCNPRLYIAYAYQRYADLWAWSGQPAIDETQAAKLLDGLQISLGDKISGPARAIRPADSVVVTVQAIPQFKLSGFTFSLSVGTIDQLLGAGKWGLNSGPYTVGTGSLFPSSPPEPPLPTEADLTPPTDTPAQAVVAPGASCSGKYVVQNGDTVYSIARKCGVDVAALVAANPDTLGVNPNYIVSGQELNIPAP